MLSDSTILNIVVYHQNLYTIFEQQRQHQQQKHEMPIDGFLDVCVLNTYTYDIFFSSTFSHSLERIRKWIERNKKNSHTSAIRDTYTRGYYVLCDWESQQKSKELLKKTCRMLCLSVWKHHVGIEWCTFGTNSWINTIRCKILRFFFIISIASQMVFGMYLYGIYVCDLKLSVGWRSFKLHHGPCLPSRFKRLLFEM